MVYTSGMSSAVRGASMNAAIPAKRAVPDLLQSQITKSSTFAHRTLAPVTSYTSRKDQQRRAISTSTTRHSFRATSSNSPKSHIKPFTSSQSVIFPQVSPFSQTRYSSHSPLGSNATNRKKVTLQTLQGMHRKNEPITMITAHDFPSAHVADHAGMDMVLVGDSLAMVALGMDDTSEVMLEEMLLHCRSVSRGAKYPFLVGDLPMGSYEIDPSQAVESAIRIIKEGRVHAVKLEGGAEMAPTISRITNAGIPVLAHIGLTPQRQHSLGGFRVQGKSISGAIKLLEDARAVEEAGAFGVVLEAVPEDVATLITQKLSIPTIGIGAGNGTSGQVLVQVDMSGNFPPGRFLPKFVKKYGDVWSEALRALEEYGKEVKSREYPAREHTYPMPAEQFEEFRKVIEAEDTVESA